jgi:ABC-type lipoprotein export system ATPase subunit
VVLVTHDDTVAAYAEREILFKDGVLASDRKIAVLTME